MRYLGRIILLVGVGHTSMLAAKSVGDVDYRVLATHRTSTMERELNEAARAGFVLVQAMGGDTEHGGDDDELVAIVERYQAVDMAEPYEYLVLATNRTGTMQNELDVAARRGFAFVAQTVFTSAYGGEEVVIIMERSPYADAPVCEYALLATTRTSTMQKELSEYARKGFLSRGLSVAKTAFGGNEVVVLTERCVAP